MKEQQLREDYQQNEATDESPQHPYLTQYQMFDLTAVTNESTTDIVTTEITKKTEREKL